MTSPKREGTNYGERFAALCVNPHLRRQAERLMDPLALIHGSKDVMSYEDVVRELANLIMALERFPDINQTACSSGITLTRGPMDGYGVHLYATDVFFLQMGFEEMVAERERREAQL